MPEIEKNIQFIPCDYAKPEIDFRTDVINYTCRVTGNTSYEKPPCTPEMKSRCAELYSQSVINRVPRILFGIIKGTKI